MSTSALRSAVIARVRSAAMPRPVVVIADPQRRRADWPHAPHVVVDLARPSDTETATGPEHVAYSGRGAVVLDLWWPEGEGVGWIDDTLDALASAFRGATDHGAAYDLIDPDPVAVRADGFVRQRLRIGFEHYPIHARATI